MTLPLAAPAPLAERTGYRLKRRLLGKPLTNDQLKHERLSKVIALGVLAPDCISSSAYGTEEILIELLPYAALGAFTLVLPITGVVLAILILLTLSYREVVSVYTKAGGSYVVARENFGPKVAQIAAVALLIDYVVTVAVQTAAGTVAVVSAIPSLGPYSLEITVGVVLLLAYGNLRGIKEAGRAFAMPTYFFTLAIGSVIVVGIIRAILGTLPQIDPRHVDGVVPIAHGHGLVMGATLLVLLRAFANGGSSLTGLEAISNGVGAFQAPEGANAKRAMLVMSVTLGFLVGGVSILAHLTHASPHTAGYPSVISQETKLVFGTGVVGHVLYGVVQTATALILYTGANTSFNGFPFLASFVAEDAFLPRQLRRRGHRLVFSNAIILLTVVALVLLIATDAQVNSLVPFYAIGVFTGFTMAGFGMARHFRREQGPGWRRKVAINFSAGALSLIVVGIFAIVKFTEGAWLVVVLFPTLVFALIRLNREYREEAEALAELRPDHIEKTPLFTRHKVLVFVDVLDLAAVEALRYGKSLRPFELRAVHFVLDDEKAHRLQSRWQTTAQTVPLDLIDVPDRRMGRASLELVARTAVAPGTAVTVLLPRRTYSAFLGRALHDRTADKLAQITSRVPKVTATIIPFDTAAKLASRQARRRRGPEVDVLEAVTEATAPAARPAAAPAALLTRERVTIQGVVRTVELAPAGNTPVFACEVCAEGGGSVTALFYGRRQVRGLGTGTRLSITGRITEVHGRLEMRNPAYELLPEGATLLA